MSLIDKILCKLEVYLKTHQTSKTMTFIHKNATITETIVMNSEAVKTKRTQLLATIKESKNPMTNFP